jgi:hypothetical protein
MNPCRIFLIAAVAALPLLSATAASAQHAPPRQNSTLRLVAGGVLGGAAGLAVGGLGGAWIGGNSCDDDGNPDSCHGAEGLFFGAVAGQSLSVPVGVHLANQRAGRLGPSLLASALIAGAGALAVTSTQDDGVLVGAVIGVPALQLVSSVLIEKATTRRR